MTPGTELASDSTSLESSLPRTVPSRVTSRSSDTLTLRSAPRRVADAPFSFSITALWILTRLTDRNFKYPAPATRIAATATITTRRNSFALRPRGGRHTCCSAVLMRAGSAAGRHPHSEVRAAQGSGRAVQLLHHGVMEKLN